MAEALSQEIIDLIHAQCDKSFTAYKNEATPEQIQLRSQYV